MDPLDETYETTEDLGLIQTHIACDTYMHTHTHPMIFSAAELKTYCMSHFIKKADTDFLTW